MTHAYRLALTTARPRATLRCSRRSTIPMDWRPSPEALIRRFEEVAPRDPPVEIRKMFGFPCRFVHGNMFMGLHKDVLVLRLPPADREALLKSPGAAIFEPSPGRTMKEYVVVPPALLASEDVRPWIDRSRRYATELPVKPPKSAPVRPAKPAPAKPAKASAKPAKPAAKPRA
jgi:TfoX/Sxy family transcriptional regulator of competence genes